ncbi:MAG: KaiC domain-containing protein [Anaerolineae bacterium]|nr:KaiC domain-containing protein [Anaerolineae bacterium]MDW8102967.1 KaiC domain-containing protein [Anaerolineae bacterium]
MTEALLDSIGTMKDLSGKIPRLEGVPTGVEGLDELFFITKIVDGKPVRKFLGGIPRYSVWNITGVSDTGKSLLVEQFAIKQVSMGNPCVFATLESPAPFVAAGLKGRALAMGVDPELVEEHIIFIDGASYYQLRNSIQTFLSTLAYAIKEYKARAVVIDSITGLYETKEVFARDVVRAIFNFLKEWRQTALLVSQKRSGHEGLSAEAAGGYAVSHIVDGSMVLSKVLITNKYEASLYRKPIGEIVRLFRIDGCRLCGHDTSTHLMEITESGLIRIGPRLSEIASKVKGEGGESDESSRT